MDNTNQEQEELEETYKEKGFGIIGIFPSPVYFTERDSNLDSIEKKEIEDILKGGMRDRESDRNSGTIDTYIFNTKLYNLKEFCEKHIKTYVKEIINPKEGADFYITQSWLNVTKPGGSHHRHFHPNSIISGIFYIETVEDDKIYFHSEISKAQATIRFESTEYNLWNSDGRFFGVADNVLILFPAWMEHSVQPNEKATKDRISLAFNVFAKGILGSRQYVNELII